MGLTWERCTCVCVHVCVCVCVCVHARAYVCVCARTRVHAYIHTCVFWSPLITSQAAFECMYTLMETCLDRLDIFEFLSHVEDGLKDHYDIKVGSTGSHDPCMFIMMLFYLIRCWPSYCWSDYQSYVLTLYYSVSIHFCYNHQVTRFTKRSLYIHPILQLWRNITSFVSKLLSWNYLC